MTNFIGTTSSASSRFFYKLSRDTLGYLTFTRVNLTTDNTVTTINDLILRAGNESQLDFEYGSDVVMINVDENHEIINKSVGNVQYKIKTDDLLYFLNDDGEMVVRVNGSYSYPANV